MFTKQFWAGFAIATVLAVCLTAWGVRRSEKDIMFPMKAFFATKDYVTFAGSIVGPDRDSMNGTVTGECDRQQGVCRLYGINQIGHNQTGPISSETINITRWDDTMMVADTKSMDPKCNYYEIKIYFPNEDVSYTRYPLKKDGICANFEHRVFNWKVDDSYAWQRLEQRDND